MFSRILVPLDSSNRSEQALPVATALAHASQGTVICLQVVNLHTGLLVERDFAQQFLQEALDDAHTYLKGVRNRFPGITLETVALRGEEASTILSVAESRECDLVVMASHGWTGFVRWALGSIAEKVTHHTSIPVLLLRTGTSQQNAQKPTPKDFRVLVPLDGSKQSESAIVPAAQLVAAFATPGHGSLHLFHVVSLSTYPIPFSFSEPSSIDERTALVQSAEHYLQSLISQLTENELAALVEQFQFTLSWEVHIEQDAASGILQMIDRNIDEEEQDEARNFDAIAMSTRGQNAWQRWVMGSVTDRVLRSTKLPLLIVPLSGS